MSKSIVTVGTGRYAKGVDRLRELCCEAELSKRGSGDLTAWKDVLPPNSPTHEAKPYAFKAAALRQAMITGYDMLLWCDACIVFGARPLDRLWDYIEEHGVWLANNGWTNHEWTAMAAYPALFGNDSIGTLNLNRDIKHVVATTFGVSLKHPTGRLFLHEYIRLAMETDAFCGPWTNGPKSADGRTAPCGPADVRGHRHDQTAASVIAHNLRIPLTSCPEWFAYRGNETEDTCLIADGAY